MRFLYDMMITDPFCLRKKTYLMAQSRKVIWLLQKQPNAPAYVYRFYHVSYNLELLTLMYSLFSVEI